MRNLIDITKINGKNMAYIFYDGAVLKPPEDIQLIPRVAEELEARRRYGQPCERIELGIDAWECALLSTVLIESDPIGAYTRMEVPATVLLCGLKTTYNPDIAPTCFEVF